MKIFYKTRATAIGGRTGHAALDDGSLAFDLAPYSNALRGNVDVRLHVTTA